MKLPVKLVAAVREWRAPRSVTNMNLRLTLELEPSALKETGHFLNNSCDCFYMQSEVLFFLINQFLLLFFVHVNMKPESDFYAEDWPGSFIFAHTFFECGTARKLSKRLIITNSVKLPGRRSVLSRSITYRVHFTCFNTNEIMLSFSLLTDFFPRVIVGRTSVHLQPVQLPQEVCRVPQHSLKGDTRRQAVT